MDTKFWTNDIDNNNSISFTSDLKPAFCELQKCLESENITLSYDDVVKGFDLFIRIIWGLGFNDNTIEEIPGINIICGPNKINNSESLKEIFKNDNIFINETKKAFIKVNSIVKNPIENINEIVNNIPTLFLEYSNMYNDIFSKSFELYNIIQNSMIIDIKERIRYSGFHWAKIDATHGIFFYIDDDDKNFKKNVMFINSNIFGEPEDTANVLMKTFDENDIPMIEECIKNLSNIKNLQN